MVRYGEVTEGPMELPYCLFSCHPTDALQVLRSSFREVRYTLQYTFEPVREEISTHLQSPYPAGYFWSGQNIDRWERVGTNGM